MQSLDRARGTAANRGQTLPVPPHQLLLPPINCPPLLPLPSRVRGHLLRGRTPLNGTHTHALIHLVSENRKIVAALPFVRPPLAFLFQHWSSAETHFARWSWSSLHFLFGDNLTFNSFPMLVLQKTHNISPQNYGAVGLSEYASKQAGAFQD